MVSPSWSSEPTTTDQRRGHGAGSIRRSSVEKQALGIAAEVGEGLEVAVGRWEAEAAADLGGVAVGVARLERGHRGRMMLLHLYYPVF